MPYCERVWSDGQNGAVVLVIRPNVRWVRGKARGHCLQDLRWTYGSHFLRTLIPMTRAFGSVERNRSVGNSFQRSCE